MSSPAFSPGDVLLSSRCPPFAHAVSAAERDSATCDGCLRRIASPRHGAGDPAACPGGCGMSAFCPPCRAAGRDLPHRRRECPLLLRAGSLRFFVDDQVRLILRVWLKIRAGEDKDGEALPWDFGAATKSSKVRRLEDLMDHAEELESGSRNLLLERWTELCSILTKKEERPSWKQFVSIYGKILVNSFSLLRFSADSSSSSSSFACALFLAASIFDHSCKPNAAAVLVENSDGEVAMNVVALAEVPSAARARICYVNCLDERSERRKLLASVWHFDCRCETCVEASDGAKRSLACGGCGEPRLLCPISLNFANPACQGGCGGGDPREEDDRRFKYRLVLDRMRELKDKDEGGRERTHDKDYWHRLKESVKEMEGLFHPMDEAYLQANLELHDHHRRGGRHRQALKYGLRTLKPLDFHGRTSGASRGFLEFGLSECWAALGNVRSARAHLRRAERILGRLNPKENGDSFWREEFEPLLESVEELAEDG